MTKFILNSRNSMVANMMRIRTFENPNGSVDRLVKTKLKIEETKGNLEEEKMQKVNSYTGIYGIFIL